MLWKRGRSDSALGGCGYPRREERQSEGEREGGVRKEARQGRRRKGFPDHRINWLLRVAFDISESSPVSEHKEIHRLGFAKGEAHADTPKLEMHLPPFSSLAESAAASPYFSELNTKWENRLQTIFC